MCGVLEMFLRESCEDGNKDQGDGALALTAFRSSGATSSFEKKVGSDFESYMERGITLTAVKF